MCMGQWPSYTTKYRYFWILLRNVLGETSSPSPSNMDAPSNNILVTSQSIFSQVEEM
jgi:hypothetical protein